MSHLGKMILIVDRDDLTVGAVYQKQNGYRFIASKWCPEDVIFITPNRTTIADVLADLRDHGMTARELVEFNCN
jgi:hypothetical protein